MTATTGVGGLIYGRALVDQKTGKKINFDELGGGNIPEDIMDLIASKAPIESPSFTGNPQAPTPSDDAVGNEIANAEFVRKLLAALVDSAPETLDTLNELAKALGDDPNFATTVTNALAGKQPLNDVLTAISNLEERADNLLCFNQDGNASLSPLSEKARSLLAQATVEAMRNELELKSAAVRDIQTDIYDRAEGRLAIPGMFGFGKVFSSGDRTEFKTEADFLRWVKTAKPGRYVVYGADKVIPGVMFSGTVEIIWPEPQANPNPAYVPKIIIFYGINGHIYYNRYWNAGDGYLVGWENWKLDTGDLIAPLQSTTGNRWGSPDVGGIMLGVYLGASDTDSRRKLVRGQTIPGSRIGCITLYSKVSASGAYQSTPTSVTHSNETQTGTFIALSGSPSNNGGTDTGYIGLFMRVA